MNMVTRILARASEMEQHDLMPLAVHMNPVDVAEMRQDVEANARARELAGWIAPEPAYGLIVWQDSRLPQGEVRMYASGGDAC